MDDTLKAAEIVKQGMAGVSVKKTRIKVFQEHDPKSLEEEFEKWANDPKAPVVPYLNMMSMGATKMLSQEHQVDPGVRTDAWVHLTLLVPYREG